MRRHPIKNAIGFVALCIVTAFVASRTISAGEETAVDNGDDSQFQVVHDEASGISQIILPATENEVAWSDVLRGLARAGHLDDAALRDILPAGKIDLDSVGAQLTIMAINVALSPEIEMSVVPAKDDRKVAALLVTLDKSEIRKTRRKVKARIRDAIGDDEKVRDRENLGLRLEDDWEKRDASERTVIVLHGFNSDSEGVSGLATAASVTNLPMGTYDYANDQPIAESAKALSQDLKKLAAEHPNRRIALLAHSMGSLVAREVLENPTLDPGNVNELIMIAPPTHGSQLARISFGVDLWEHFLGSSEGGPVKRFYRAVEDGLAEADNDLRPGSDFLKTLNGRERNKDVEYSIFLGTGGLITDEELELVRNSVDKAAKESRAVQLIRPLFDDMLSDLDEVLMDKGDGVVAVKVRSAPAMQITTTLAAARRRSVALPPLPLRTGRRPGT